MGVFKMGTLAEEQAKQSEYIPLKENLYILEVFNAEMVKGKAYQDPSTEVDQIKITFKAVKPADGSPLQDMNGDYPAKNLLSIWLNPDAVGFNKKTNKPHKTRAVLTAVMNIAIDADLDIESWSDLIGLQCKAYVELNPRGDGSFSNKLDKFSPIPGEKKVNVKPQAVSEQSAVIEETDPTPSNLPWEESK